jgi:hypothetical protein
MISKVLVAIGGVGVLATAATAGPIARADVSAEPAWVLHIDFDKLRSTTIGKHILEETRKPDVDQKLAGFTAFTGVDPRQDLFGATLYSPGGAPDDPVVLVYAKFDPDKLVNVAKAAKDYKSSEYEKHVIHSWIDEKKADQGEKARMYGAFHGKRVVFGQKEASVRGALDVLDGRADTLVKSKRYSQLGTPGDAFIQAAASKMPVSEGDPNAAVLKQTKSVWFEAMETGKQATASLKLEGNDAEVAKSMVSIGEGLVSLLKLQQDKPIALKVSEGLSIRQEGSIVIVNLKMATNDVINLIKTATGSKEEKKEEKRASQ